MRRRTFLLLTGAIPSIARALPLAPWVESQRLQAAAPGIKITTIHRSLNRHVRSVNHEPFSRSVLTGDVHHTFHLQGEWRRLEAPGHTLDPICSGPFIATVVRPDLGQIFELNLDTRKYFSWPWPPDLTDEAFTGLILKMHTRFGNLPTDPTFRTETTDTGERKEMFGYLAKHLITTTKWGTARESVRDGWYIDLEPQFYPILYQPEWIAGEPRDPETGFAVQEVETLKSPVRIRSEMEVTIEKGTYDQALFEVPPGFKRLDYYPAKFGRGKRHHLLRQSSTSNLHKSMPFDAT